MGSRSDLRTRGIIDRILCDTFLKSFPEFVVVHTAKGFSIVSEVDGNVFFWDSLALSMIKWLLAI